MEYLRHLLTNGTPFVYIVLGTAVVFILLEFYLLFQYLFKNSGPRSGMNIFSGHFESFTLWTLIPAFILLLYLGVFLHVGKKRNTTAQVEKNFSTPTHKELPNQTTR